MQCTHRLFKLKMLALAVLAAQGVSFEAAAAPACKLITAARVFDGINPPQANKSVLVVGDKVQQVGNFDALKGQCASQLNLGDATILPGFIESHAHVTFQNVRKDAVLEHGITTVQDTGGPLLPPQGGNGTLRLLSTGPIIQAQGGYPLNVFSTDGIGGYDKIGVNIADNATENQVKQVVIDLVNGGATAIKIALESGGEAGAPWMMPHGAAPVPPNGGSWPILSLQHVQWIVQQAHLMGKRVIAHVGEDIGFARALDGGVDELAHMPCAAIASALLEEAVHSGTVTFVTTADTLASCPGIHANMHGIAHVLEHHSGEIPYPFIYGSEVAHDNVPWGINGEELHAMLHMTSGTAIDFGDVMNVMTSATGKAGARLGIPGLGTLTPNAPADLIAVKGNPFERFKLLEYPDLVMSGGKLVVYKFTR